MPLVKEKTVLAAGQFPVGVDWVLCISSKKTTLKGFGAKKSHRDECEKLMIHLMFRRSWRFINFDAERCGGPG